MQISVELNKICVAEKNIMKIMMKELLSITSCIKALSAHAREVTRLFTCCCS